MSSKGRLGSVEDLYSARIRNLARELINGEALYEFSKEIYHDNPYCGDSVRLQLRIQNRKIMAISQVVHGCTICKASACLIDRNVVGLGLKEVDLAHDSLRRVVMGNELLGPGAWPDIEVFQPLQRFRGRWNCAFLPFQALSLALN